MIYLYSMDDMKVKDSVKIVIKQKDYPEAFKVGSRLSNTVGKYGLSKFTADCLVNFKAIVKCIS